MPSPPGDLPDPGMEPTSLMSPVLAGGFLITSTTWKAHILFISCGNYFHSLLKITQKIIEYIFISACIKKKFLICPM